MYTKKCIKCFYVVKMSNYSPQASTYIFSDEVKAPEGTCGSLDGSDRFQNGVLQITGKKKSLPVPR